MFKIYGMMKDFRPVVGREALEGLRVEASQHGADLIRDASARGVDFQADLSNDKVLYFRAKMLGYDLPNGNGDAISRVFAADFGPSFIGKHLDVNHETDPANIIGKVVSTFHVEAALPGEPGAERIIGLNALADDDSDATKELQLEGICRIDRNTELGELMAQKLLAGTIDGVSQEASTEYAKCSVCEHKVGSPFERVCEHLENGSLMIRSYQVEGRKSKVLAFKNHFNPVGTGLAVVTVPAYDRGRVQQMQEQVKAGKLALTAALLDLREQALLYKKPDYIMAAIEDLQATKTTAALDTALTKLNGHETLALLEKFKAPAEVRAASWGSLAVGEFVNHKKFGPGVVKWLHSGPEGKQVTVDFEWNPAQSLAGPAVVNPRDLTWMSKADYDAEVQRLKAAPADAGKCVMCGADLVTGEVHYTKDGQPVCSQACAAADTGDRGVQAGAEAVGAVDLFKQYLAEGRPEREAAEAALDTVSGGAFSAWEGARREDAVTQLIQKAKGVAAAATIELPKEHLRDDIKEFDEVARKAAAIKEKVGEMKKEDQAALKKAGDAPEGERVEGAMSKCSECGAAMPADELLDGMCSDCAGEKIAHLAMEMMKTNADLGYEEAQNRAYTQLFGALEAGSAEEDYETARHKAQHAADLAQEAEGQAGMIPDADDPGTKKYLARKAREASGIAHQRLEEAETALGDGDSGLDATLFRQPRLLDSYWAVLGTQGELLARVTIAALCGGNANRVLRVAGKPVSLGRHLTSDAWAADLRAEAKRRGTKAVLTELQAAQQAWDLRADEAGESRKLSDRWALYLTDANQDPECLLKVYNARSPQALEDAVAHMLDTGLSLGGGDDEDIDRWPLIDWKRVFQGVRYWKDTIKPLHLRMWKDELREAGKELGPIPGASLKMKAYSDIERALDDYQSGERSAEDFMAAVTRYKEQQPEKSRGLLIVPGMSADAMADALDTHLAQRIKTERRGFDGGLRAGAMFQEVTGDEPIKVIDLVTNGEAYFTDKREAYKHAAVIKFKLGHNYRIEFREPNGSSSVEGQVKPTISVLRAALAAARFWDRRKPQVSAPSPRVNHAEDLNALDPTVHPQGGKMRAGRVKQFIAEKARREGKTFEQAMAEVMAPGKPDAR